MPLTLTLADSDPYRLGPTPPPEPVAQPPRAPMPGEPLVVRYSCGQFWVHAGAFDRFDSDGSPVTKREFVSTTQPIPIAAYWIRDLSDPPDGWVPVPIPGSAPFPGRIEGVTMIEGWDPGDRSHPPRVSVGYYHHYGAGYGAWAFLGDGLHLPASRRLPIVCAVHANARAA